MVEILKPNDYKKIIEGLFDLDDEMDIMRHLENYHAKYAEDNYHFSAILSDKISEIDDYDTTEDVQKYYYNQRFGDPNCTISIYADSPNAVIRFAKVYIDYLAYCDDLVYPNDEMPEEGESDEDIQLTFKTVLGKERLLMVYNFLIEKEIIEASSPETFVELFNSSKNHTEPSDKIKWRLAHQGKNSNRPMFSLFCFIDNKDESEFYQDEMKQFVRTIIANVIPVKEKNKFVQKSLEASFRRWKLLHDNFLKNTEPSLDDISIEIINYLQSLKK
jgi:hypothetical protein